MALMLHTEQDAGAVPALALVSVQVVAENAAVRLIAEPSALMVTPLNTWVVPVVVLPTATDAVPSPVKFSRPDAGGLAKVTVTVAVKVSSPAVPVFWPLHAEMLLTTTLAMLHAEQEAGAVPAFTTVKEQIGESEKVAVRLMALPSAVIVTFWKVWVVPERLPTATLVLPSPLRTRLPVAGTSAKVTVTSAVNVSSPAAFVFWLWHGVISLVVIETILQLEQAAGAVPAVAFVKVQTGVAAEKDAVRLMALPSADMVTPVKVCEVPKPVAETLAVPSPVRLSVPVVG